MTDLDTYWPPVEPRETPETPRKHRHVWVNVGPLVPVDADTVKWTRTECERCGVVRDETRARRGKQSRNYGNRAELAVARTYGGQKIGHAGGPVDVRGADWNTQVKTHRRTPPREWTKAFAAMSANRERMPRLLLRFVMGPGVPPEDYFVVRGADWLAWHGKDEPE